MANDLTNVTHKILARGLKVLREKAVMPRLVNSDYSDEAKKKGDVINVPVPTAIGVSNVTPSNVLPAPVDYDPGTVAIPLEQWKKNDPFHLTDKELTQISASEHYLPMAAAESIRSLANTINAFIQAQYVGVYGYVGTAGTTPFSSDVTPATLARKVLNEQLCPKEMRRGVVDFSAEAEMLALSQFADADKTMSNQVVMEGEIGRKYGIDWVSDDTVPLHTAGTATGYLVNNASVAIGDTSVPVDTGSNDAVVGDIFTVSGDTQTYVITAITGSAPMTALTFQPAAQVAWANNAPITFKLSHRVNMVFHRDAFAFAMRPLLDSMLFTGGNHVAAMQDPQTGVVLRLELMRQYKQTVWEFDVLYGAKLIRPELACRIAG